MSSVDDPQSNGAFFTCALVGLLVVVLLMIVGSLSVLYAWMTL